jgi:hypothetical protein
MEGKKKVGEHLGLLVCMRGSGGKYEGLGCKWELLDFYLMTGR